MASRYFGLNRGQTRTDVVEGSSTGSKTFELAVNLADNADRREVLIAMEEIRDYILAGIWPPA